MIFILFLFCNILISVTSSMKRIYRDSWNNIEISNLIICLFSSLKNFSREIDFF